MNVRVDRMDGRVRMGVDLVGADAELIVIAYLSASDAMELADSLHRHGEALARERIVQALRAEVDQTAGG